MVGRGAPWLFVLGVTLWATLLIPVLFYNRGAINWLTLFSVGLLAPIVEELFFRGALWAGLRHILQRLMHIDLRLITGACIAVTAIMFALLHSKSFSAPLLGLGFVAMGVAFGLARVYAGVWGAVIAHGIANCAYLLGLALGISLPW